MRIAHALARWNNAGCQDVRIPTELCRIGKKEEFLQRAIEMTPELLGLDSRRTGICGPYVPFLELPLWTPTERQIYPDIVFLTASGHIVIVEVKLSNNPELRERDVIAQILDYASAFSCLSREALCDLFDKTQSANRDWPLVIQKLFSNDIRTEELADVLFERIQRGEVNIVIACDRLPSGTAEMVASISAQRTLGFTCDVVEIVPFVQKETHEDALIFVPTIRVATEIVARTAVTVTYQTGQVQPSTSVEVSTVDDIKKKIDAIEKRSRVWDDAEVENSIRENEDTTTVRLLELCKALSVNGEFNTVGEKITPCFGYHLEVPLPNGHKAKRCVFSCMPASKALYFYLDTVQKVLDQSTYEDFRQRLSILFPTEINLGLKQPGISIGGVADRFNGFDELMRWLKEKAEMRSRLGG